MQAFTVTSCCHQLTTQIPWKKRSRSQEEELWRQLLSSPRKSWDNRIENINNGHPDFRNMQSGEPLWLSSPLKPSWVDAHITALKPSTRETRALFQQLSYDVQYFCENGDLDMAISALYQMGQVPASNKTYMCLLRACNKFKSQHHVQLVIDHLRQHRVELSGLLGDYLAMVLAKCGCYDDAHYVFKTIPKRTVYSWTAMIDAEIDCGRPYEALKLYKCMIEDGVEPDKYTFVSLIKACATICDLERGKELHEAARKKGFTSDVYVQTTLVSMYSKCGYIENALSVLAESLKLNIEPANAIISAYLEQGRCKEILLFFRQLQVERIGGDEVTFAVAAQACGMLEEKDDSNVLEEHSFPLEIGRALHSDGITKGLSQSILFGTTLVSMYGKLGDITAAENVFVSLFKYDAVSWSAMLSAYVEKSVPDKALQLYTQMLKEGVYPDHQTYAITFQACGLLANVDLTNTENRAIALEIGKALHCDAKRGGFVNDVFVSNAILSMYGKCGDIGGAESIFSEMIDRDIVSWNTMLSAYAEQGDYEQALRLYSEMLNKDGFVNEITFVCVLQSCCGVGSLDICHEIHSTIIAAEFDSSPLLRSTLIYAYGMCASMADAESVLNELPKRDAVSWNACISGYSREGNFTTTFKLFDKMLEAGIKPDETTFSSLLAVCAHIGHVDKAVDLFKSMMSDYDLAPGFRHYVCMIDLLSRAGDFCMVEKIISEMPMEMDLNMWLCLLSACRVHGNVELGEIIFRIVQEMHTNYSAAFILMSNIYAESE